MAITTFTYTFLVKEETYDDHATGAGILEDIINNAIQSHFGGSASKEYDPQSGSMIIAIDYAEHKAMMESIAWEDAIEEEAMQCKEDQDLDGYDHPLYIH